MDERLQIFQDKMEKSLANLMRSSRESVQDVRIRMCWTNFVLIITEHRLRFRALQMSVFRSRE